MKQVEIWIRHERISRTLMSRRWKQAVYEKQELGKKFKCPFMNFDNN